MAHGSKRLLAVLCAAIVIYAMAVLGFVITSPDLRLRCLLVEDQARDSRGIPVHVGPNLQYRGPGG
ncbi:MAG TPA: hypothetical protein VML55_17535, partial [Planctomycetaceae bacterium]|nr:hypothetical protein [Planctomycetaceae bacterium]